MSYGRKCILFDFLSSHFYSSYLHLPSCRHRVQGHCPRVPTIFILCIPLLRHLHSSPSYLTFFLKLMFFIFHFSDTIHLFSLPPYNICPLPICSGLCQTSVSREHLLHRPSSTRLSCTLSISHKLHHLINHVPSSSATTSSNKEPFSTLSLTPTSFCLYLNLSFLQKLSFFCNSHSPTCLFLRPYILPCLPYICHDILEELTSCKLDRSH